MATIEDATKKALLEQIKNATEDENRPSALLQLAEAYAWVVRPNQHHGGGSGDA